MPACAFRTGARHRFAGCGDGTLRLQVCPSAWFEILDFSPATLSIERRCGDTADAIA
jgi:hypothetical protein